MNKKIIIPSIIIGVLLIVLFSFIYLSPKIKEINIKNEIEKANYCSIDSDCIDAGGKCPFGCYNYVNKNESNKISKLLKSYDSKCIYGCVQIKGVSCENNKCKIKY